MDEQEMGQHTPQRARDDEDNIVKTEMRRHPSWEVIDPWVYMKLSRAVNYDLTFQPTTKLGDTVGAWTSRPFNRPGYGAIMEEYLKQLKAEKKVKWELRAFLFTHDQGIKARMHYVEQVLRGKIRATTSWGPNPEREEDKSRFHKLVPRSLAEELKFDYKENETDTYFGQVKDDNFVPQSYFKDNDFVIVTIDQLKDRYPELYKAKTSTYVKKEEKQQKIKKAFETLEESGEENISTDLIAQQINESWATPAEVAKQMQAATSEAKEKKQTVIEEQPELNFDDLVPPLEESQETAEQVDDLTSDIEHAEDYESEEEVIAAAVAVEEAEEVDAEKAAGSLNEIQNADNCFKNNRPHKLRVFSDAKLLELGAEYEGVILPDGTEIFLLESEALPYGKAMVQQGKHIIGDPTTGLTHYYEVYKANVSASR